MRTLLTKGPMGIWEMVKAKMGNLKQMIIGPVMGFVRNKLIIAGIETLLGILIPWAGLLKAALSLYRGVVFLIENKDMILDTVEGVLNSVAAVASGKLGNAAKFIEKNMARGLTLLLLFLAKFLKLDGISKVMRNILEKIRKPINRALDVVIVKVIRFAGRALRKIKGGLKALAKKLNLNKIKVAFTMMNSPHTLSLRGGKRKIAIIMASAYPGPILQKIEKTEKEVRSSNAPNSSEIVAGLKKLKRKGGLYEKVISNFMTGATKEAAKKRGGKKFQAKEYEKKIHEKLTKYAEDVTNFARKYNLPDLLVGKNDIVKVGSYVTNRMGSSYTVNDYSKDEFRYKVKEMKQGLAVGERRFTDKDGKTKTDTKPFKFNELGKTWKAIPELSDEGDKRKLLILNDLKKEMPGLATKQSEKARKNWDKRQLSKVKMEGELLFTEPLSGIDDESQAYVKNTNLHNKVYEKFFKNNKESVGATNFRLHFFERKDSDWRVDFLKKLGGPAITKIKGRAGELKEEKNKAQFDELKYDTDFPLYAGEFENVPGLDEKASKELKSIFNERNVVQKLMILVKDKIVGKLTLNRFNELLKESDKINKNYMSGLLRRHIPAAHEFIPVENILKLVNRAASLTDLKKAVDWIRLANLMRIRTKYLIFKPKFAVEETLISGRKVSLLTGHAGAIYVARIKRDADANPKEHQQAITQDEIDSNPDYEGKLGDIKGPLVNAQNTEEPKMAMSGGKVKVAGSEDEYIGWHTAINKLFENHTEMVPLIRAVKQMFQDTVWDGDAAEIDNLQEPIFEELRSSGTEIIDMNKLKGENGLQRRRYNITIRLFDRLAKHFSR